VQGFTQQRWCVACSVCIYESKHQSYSDLKVK